MVEYNFYNELTSIMDISGIIHAEKNRLNQKSVGIQQAITSQNRMIQLNQSYASRMREYSYMIMIIALTVVFIVVLMFFQNILPSRLYTFLFMLFSITGIIWALVIYIGIMKRDNVDFDKIHSTPPDSAIDGSGNILASSINSGKISDAIKWNQWDACVGNNCCSSGTIFNKDSNVCVKAPFTSLSQAYSTGEFTGNVLNNYDNQRTSLVFSSYS
jgi:hypothetical protein